MPARQNVVKHETPTLQGDDSFVLIRRPTMGELDEIRKEVTDTNDTDAQLKLGEKMIAKFIVNWNWVDDAGNPLPPPSHEGVMSMLTDVEVKYILDLFLPDEAAAGIAKKKSNS